MVLERYEGPATIVQRGGVAAPYLCSYVVEELPYGGPVRWRGTFTGRPEDAGRRLDPLAPSELVLPDGRRGPIAIDDYVVGVDYAGPTERGSFAGTGPYPGQRPPA